MKLSSFVVVFIDITHFLFTEDEDWGGMCANGKQQSPVDLVKDAAIIGVFPHFIFENYDKPMTDVNVLNNGHSSKFFYCIFKDILII